MAWLVWVVLAGVLGLAELHTVTLVLGMLAVAALPAALAAALDASPAAQVAVFAASSVLLLGVVRPIARRHRHTPVELRTGTAALVGRQGVAVTGDRRAKRPGPHRRRGLVGAPLRARTGRPGGRRRWTFSPIDGATALVLPLPDDELEAQ